MKKEISVFMLLVGIAAIVYGFSIKVPGSSLTTYSSMDGYRNYSAIEEYVGGDAYNYIIGATLVGSRISAAMTSQTIFIAVGVLICCIGLIGLAYSEKRTPEAGRLDPTLQHGGNELDSKAAES